MVNCHYSHCSFNREHQCTALEELALDESARCLFAQQHQQETLETILEFLERFSRYPFDEEKDREFFEELLIDFADINVLEQLKRFQAWLLDLDECKKINYRTTIRKWMQRTHERNCKSKTGAKKKTKDLLPIG